MPVRERRLKMAELEVYLIHPTTDARSRARLDDNMTAQEVIDDLQREGFLDRRDFELSIKGGPLIRGNESLRNAGVQGGATLRILPLTQSAHGEGNL
jgi:hypothetical protein